MSHPLHHEPYESSEPALVDALRKEVADDDFMVPAFVVTVQDTRARAVGFQIRNGILSSSITAGSVEPISIDLAGIETGTLGGLVEFLNAIPGYCVSPDKELEHGHESTDLRIKGHGDARKGGIKFFHRRWSDVELVQHLDRAARRHNMSYTARTVPVAEQVFVVTLAAASVALAQAQIGAKRRGLSFDVEKCLDIAAQLEAQYSRDRNRQQRAIPVASIKDTDIGGGDVVQGTFFRRNLRYGSWNQAAQAPPETPRLYTPGEEDVQDTQIRLGWSKVRDVDFRAMELWRDTRPNVQRAQLGNTTAPPENVARSEFFSTTAKLVFSPRWVNSTNWHSYLSSRGVVSGQILNDFVDGHDQAADYFAGTVCSAPPIEPNRTYYYRLYVIDVNGEAVGSDVVEVRTKRMRAKMSRDASVPILDPVKGPMSGGTSVTLRGTRFHAGMRVLLGDCPVDNLVIVDATTATFDTPEVFNEQVVGMMLDLVVISDTGLEDTTFKVWSYEANP